MPASPPVELAKGPRKDSHHTGPARLTGACSLTSGHSNGATKITLGGGVNRVWKKRNITTTAVLVTMYDTRENKILQNIPAVVKLFIVCAPPYRHEANDRFEACTNAPATKGRTMLPPYIYRQRTQNNRWASLPENI